MSDDEIRVPDRNFADRLICDDQLNDRSYHNYNSDEDIAHDVLNREDLEMQNFILADIAKNKRIKELSEICTNLIRPAVPKLKRLITMDKSNKSIYNNLLNIIAYLNYENPNLDKNYKKHLLAYDNLMSSDEATNLTKSINDLIEITR